MTIIADIEVREMKVPLRATFKTALRSVDELSVIQVIINRQFIGEAVETPAITGDTLEAIMKDCREVDFQGLEIGDAQLFYREHIRNLPITASAKSALDMAIHGAAGTFQGEAHVRTDVTVPIATIEEFPKIISDRRDFDVLKIKFGREPVENLIEKMRAIRELAPHAQLRVDPNQSWSTELALEFVKNLEKEGIELDYLEQPCKRDELSAFVDIRAHSAVQLMADESCFTERDLMNLIELGVIDWVNLKSLKSGGISEVLHLARIARDAGIKVSIGSMMESDAGVRSAIHVAAHIAPAEIHDVDAAWWLKSSSLQYVKGQVLTG